MRRIIFALWCATSLAQARADLPGLPEAAAYSATRGETALLVWQNGRTIYERAKRPNIPQRIFSITKSLVSIGVFRDAKTGGLSLAQPARHRAAQGVVLSDLLNQTSGLPSASREFYSHGLKDKGPVLDRLRVNGNGGLFSYGPSHWEVLAEEIREQRGPSLEGWVRKFVPGARSGALALWTRDDEGRLFFSTGARMDAAGLLPAGRGVLDGIQRGKWPAEVRAMLAQGTEANRMYALGFWLNRGALRPGAREIDVESSLGRDQSAEFWGNGCLCRAAPPDLLAMIGTRGQRVYVVPSLDLVVVRQGGGRGFSDAEFLRRLFASKL
jgi:CubicO group peptidase (beta-lactamase class C family)